MTLIIRCNHNNSKAINWNGFDNIILELSKQEYTVLVLSEDGKGTPLKKRRVAALVIGGIGLAACGLALCTEAGVVMLDGAAVAGGVYYYYRRTHQTNG